MKFVIQCLQLHKLLYSAFCVVHSRWCKGKGTLVWFLGPWLQQVSATSGSIGTSAADPVILNFVPDVSNSALKVGILLPQSGYRAFFLLVVVFLTLFLSRHSVRASFFSWLVTVYRIIYSDCVPVSTAHIYECFMFNPFFGSLINEELCCWGKPKPLVPPKWWDLWSFRDRSCGIESCWIREAAHSCEDYTKCSALERVFHWFLHSALFFFWRGPPSMVSKIQDGSLARLCIHCAAQKEGCDTEMPASSIQEPVSKLSPRASQSQMCRWKRPFCGLVPCSFQWKLSLSPAWAP